MYDDVGIDGGNGELPDHAMCASVRQPTATLLSPETAPRMRELQIRRAEPAEATIIGPLVQRSIRATNAADYDAAIIESMCANFAPDKFLERMAARDVFAAIQDGEIIGTVSLPRSKLYSLFIEPHVQRGGVGKRLVHYIEQHAKSLGCTDLQLSAAITAKPFYDRLGYATIRFEERINDGSTWLMRKTLGCPHLAKPPRAL
jgi:putative acetyltransferase